MNKTLLTIDYNFLTIKAVSPKGSILVQDDKHDQEYWILRRVFMRLINLRKIDGVIATSFPKGDIQKEMRTLMVLSPF